MTDNLRGILAITASMFFFCVGDTVMKLMGTKLPIGQMVLIRGIVATVLVLAAAQWLGVLGEWRKILTPRIAWRAFFEAACTVLFFIGLINMSYADASAIGQFTPLMIMAGAAIFLGEPVGWRRWTAAGVGFLGVLLVVKPGTTAFQPVSLIMLASMVCVAARDLITRRLPRDVPTVLVTLSSVAGGMVVGPLMAPFETWGPVGLRDVAVLALCAVTVLAGYAFVIIGMRVGDTAVVSPFRYAYMVFALLSSVLVFREHPDALSLAGIALVVGSGLYMVHREQMKRRELRRVALAV